MFLLLAFLLAAAASTHAARTPSPTIATPDTKQYSYICLRSNQNLCLGISPGEGLPYYDPESIFKLQIKQRLRNQDAGTDFKKTRWDVDYGHKTISLSRFTDLCMATQFNSDYVALYPCDQSRVNGTFDGLLQLAFNQNIEEMAEIKREADPTMCMTVMACNADRNGYCNFFSNFVSPTFTSGSIVRMKKCWFAPGGDASHKAAQTFVQALDCAPGCSPMMLNNDVCDRECANPACDLDNGLCVSAAPTMPTQHPTVSPTTSMPSTSPTQFPTHRPTSAPTGKPTKLPTVAPSHSPVKQQTSQPTKLPTKLPSLQPTGGPTVAPTVGPSASPTYSAPSRAPTTSRPTAAPTSSAPSATPSRAPTEDPYYVMLRQQQEEEQQMMMLIIGVAIPFGLILLCCLAVYCIARDRRRRFEKRPKQWGSMIDVNQAAYKEYFKEHGQNKKSSWCAWLFCCGVCRGSCCSRRARDRGDSTPSLGGGGLGCCLAPLAPSASNNKTQSPSAFSSHYRENQQVAAYNPEHQPPPPPQQQQRHAAMVNPAAGTRHAAMINPSSSRGEAANSKSLPIVMASVARTHGKHTARPIQQKTTHIVAYNNNDDDDCNEGYII